jgi:phosphoribosylformylglycinamidine synthase subunit PurQ / glutaminase
MKFGIIVFPGTNCDQDCFYVLSDLLGQDVRFIWHKQEDLSDFECLVLPGGFSYGDYLRSGAIARFSPVMNAICEHAQAGRAVIGICNGFQILLEAGLLPGAMLPNQSLSFICRDISLRVENHQTLFSSQFRKDEIIQMPIAHGQGNYYADDETLAQLEAHHQVVFRYGSRGGSSSGHENPNGSRNAIAGIVNRQGNVLGLMPHPERSSEQVLGGENGRRLFQSVIDSALSVVNG